VLIGSCDLKYGLKFTLRYHRGDQIENFAAAFTDRQDGKKTKKSDIKFAMFRSRMKNLRPLLSVDSVPVISYLVSNLLFDIIEVMK
jgi:hypothetical protein